MIFAYLWSLIGSVWAALGTREGQHKLCSGCGGGTALGGVIYKDVKVAKKFRFLGYLPPATRPPLHGL